MKNGFTLTELIGVIVLIAILSGLAVISVNNVIESGKKGLLQNYEKTMEGAARNVIADYVDASSMTIEDSTLLRKIKNNWNSEIFELSYNELKNNNYIDPLEDPYGGNCEASKVVITRRESIGNNIMFDYKACVICSGGTSDYTTNDC